MPKITTLSYSRSIILLVLAFFGLQSYIYSQCAGNDNTVESCSKQDQQFIDLFKQLNGDPSTGGTWSDDDDSGGVDNADPTNGMLDTYAITRGGVFHYTYTISGDGSCTDNTATITLTLGSYAGLDNTNGVACDTDSSVNLFQFSGSSPSPTGDGEWSSTGSPAGYSGGRVFNAAAAGEGTYTFIYKVPAQGSCPATQSMVRLEVVPAPKSGTAEKKVFCETQDFSGLRNYNLRNLLTGEDDDGAWSESSKTDEIARPGDPFINLENLRDLGPGLYDFTYTVNPINPTCVPASTIVTIEIEKVVDFSSAVFNITDPTENICVNDLPYQAKAKITVDAGKVPNGTYDLTYKVSPAPNVGMANIKVNFTDGIGTFDINPDFITGLGDVNVEVTEIKDPNTQNNCQAAINGLTASFKVTSPPDISDSQVIINDPVCLGEGTTATLSDKGDAAGIQLADGIYGVEYSITGADGTPSATVTIKVVNGTAVFGLQLDDQVTAGDYTFHLRSIRSSGTCITSAVNIEDDFTISPKPDAKSLTLAATDACGQDDIAVSLTDAATPLNFINGTYTLSYSLTGNNDLQATLDNVVFTDGKANFSLDGSTLAKGKTTITINSLQNNASSCEAINTEGLTTSFTLSRKPDLANSTFSIDPVCEGQNVAAILTATVDDVPDADYAITYSITKEGNTTDHTASAKFKAGTGSFDIAPEAITDAATYTLTINGFSNTATGCTANGLPITADFEVFANPDLDAATLTASTVCSGNDVSATITGAALANGDYKVTYALTGANTLNDSINTLTFMDGAASFAIASGKLVNTGENILNLLSIKTVQTGCEVQLTGMETNFTINTAPDLSTATLSYDKDLCFGSAETVTVKDQEGNLKDGAYTLSYSLGGANVASGQTASLTVASGEGSFTVPAEQLANPGSTSFTIDDLVFTATSCALDSPGLGGSFNINALPDLSSASIAVADSCEGTMERNITLQAPNLDNGTYSFIYALSVANTDTATTDSVTVQDGSAVLIIDGTLLKNTGETDVVLTSVISAATSCASEELNIATTFMINPRPQIASENIMVSSMCLSAVPAGRQESHTVTINEPGLGNGTYTLTYNLSGANAKADEAINVTTVNGQASFTLDAAALTTSGNTTLTISNITNSTTLCTSTETSSTDFEVYPIPTLTGASVGAMDVCLNEDGLVTISKESGLADTDYTLTYSLSGAVNASAKSAQLSTSGGAGNFTIPTSLLNAPGQVTVTIEELTSAEGCTSGALSISTSFEVLPLPDAAGIVVDINDQCINNDVPVTISGAANLANGDYRITYSLSGSNAGSKSVDVAFAGGSTTFTLTAAELPKRGNTTLTITNIQNFVDLCGAENINGASAAFVVQDPDPPTLATNGNVFCINDAPKISDLLANITPTVGLRVYETATDNVSLNENNTLLNGKSYFISVTGAGSGCESSVRLEVVADLTGCDNIFIPDGFSPNGDGVNDTFEVQNIGFVYPDYTIEIFNRLGNVVYKGGAGMPAWDGHSNKNAVGGNVLPNGVYFYIINYNDGQTGPKQGKLYLNR